ncbi:OB-fold nucleic acid binding domain-containing protein [Nocardioides sp. NBC_00368]|uniref:OB-fold nucleic acid binding domain-containing protein n=1 Tax=unclassified Nocardioides TaxID=2615069 RepID=UPI0019A302F1|nr:MULTISPECIES: OB-fold nucleic acid binding domain-containing protein [unclassified Nocardioides]MBC7277084.1 OB-fold nucleic acid binding domain-containing protein [Nocardioides sp.]
MTENLADDVSALLSARGWSITRDNPNGASLWSLDGRAEMYLPRFITRGSFEWSDITERVATAHGERASVILREVEMVRFDVTRFRVNDDAPDGPTVPLEAAATVVGSAFGMLRAAATAARRPRQSIGSNYSKLGDEIVREARLGHTETGSFIFPVMLRLSDPVPERETPLPHATVESVRPESSERRVTRTLAQAMSAFDKHVLQPAHDPQMKDLTPVVVAGGTKEMFAQLSRSIAEPGVAWLETGFNWAPIESASSGIPRAVTVPADADAREILTRTVRLLSTPKSEPLRVITGPIIHISHVPGEPLGEIAIQTPSPSGSRFGRVEVVVREEQLSEIHHWMDSGTTVVVHGTVERRPGRPIRLKGVSTPQPLSDTFDDVE